MMGRLNRDQKQLFYAFDLEEAVPSDHPVREIARVLDLSWVRNALAPHYSHTGRPSIDPELMLRMLILGYVFAIRSERQLVREVQVNLAYRWFCGLGIEDRVPDHSAFSRARNERFRDSNILRELFERVVSDCIEARLVGGEGFAVDASLIEADANKCRSIPGKDWNKNRNRETANRAVREYLDTLDDAAFGAASNVTPKFVSRSDPAAQWTGAMKDKAFFAYADNYLIDTQHGIIMDVEATRAIRQAEVGASRTMLERTEQRFGIKPRWLAGDTAYGSAENLGWLVTKKGIEPHVPVIDKSKRDDGTYSRTDFAFDSETNTYICPAGKTLKQVGHHYADDVLRYFADRGACEACPMKDRCCPNSIRRKVTRSIHEPARNVARALAETEAFEETRRHRKKVEMAFAHLKRILRMSRLRLRGPTGAQDEFTLAAIAQNLRKMARLIQSPQTA
jgi:transposase/Fe-S cluster biogenesis protein NfuA